MVTPVHNSTAIVDLNLSAIGSAKLPSWDLTLASPLWRHSISDNVALGWYVGPTFQAVIVSPEQTHQSGDRIVPSIGARTELVLGYRPWSHIRLLARAGIGTHVGIMSTRDIGSVVTEGEGFVRGAVAFMRVPGLPETICPMIQGSAGLGVFHPQDGPLTVTPILGGGLGVLWLF